MTDRTYTREISTVDGKLLGQLRNLTFIDIKIRLLQNLRFKWFNLLQNCVEYVVSLQ
jgi:hypothetical protein